MGMQDRDWYKEATREKAAAKARKPWRAVNPFSSMRGGLPRWFTFVVGCLTAYGFVSLFRDLGKLIH